jgi:hypothetical protein
MSAALRLRFYNAIWGPFLSALHGLRILLRTSRKGTACGCRRFMVCASLCKLWLLKQPEAAGASWFAPSFANSA